MNANVKWWRLGCRPVNEIGLDDWVAMRTRRKYSREEAGTYWLSCTTVWHRREPPSVQSDAALRQRQGEPRGVGAYAPFRSWYPDQQFTARFMLHIFGLLYCNTVLSPGG